MGGEGRKEGRQAGAETGDLSKLCHGNGEQESVLQYTSNVM